MSSAFAATNPWEYYYYSMFIWPRGARNGELGAQLSSKLHIVCEYNAAVELVSTCHRMRRRMWMWARGSSPVLVSSWISHNEIGHKQSLLLVALRYIFIYRCQSAFYSTYEKERDTRCCLAIVCLRRKVNEEVARVDGECILYWVFGITQYNTIFYVCNRINMGKS